ncbi:hypothetical protein HN51_037995 [Arachis hypogaea]|nr:uncharacterized protein DS421_13g433820 [Arachis hypogaea]
MLPHTNRRDRGRESFGEKQRGGGRRSSLSRPQLSLEVVDAVAVEGGHRLCTCTATKPSLLLLKYAGVVESVNGEGERDGSKKELPPPRLLFRRRRRVQPPKIAEPPQLLSEISMEMR